uniref:Uncharacterized protein n=1 Tax=Mushroom bacilliform virus TaxID=32625 RepID=A0A1Q1M979_9VIRU|nr:hypothetical protein [Mushroom bacilliform virus]
MNNVEISRDECKAMSHGLYCRVASDAQLQRAGWLVQFAVVPRKGQKQLAANWPFYLVLHRALRNGPEFVGFLLFAAREIERIRTRLGSGFRKTLVVGNDHFNKYIKYNGKTIVWCDVLCGTVVPKDSSHCPDVGLETFVPGTVLSGSQFATLSQNIGMALRGNCRCHLRDVCMVHQEVS